MVPPVLTLLAPIDVLVRLGGLVFIAHKEQMAAIVELMSKCVVTEFVLVSQVREEAIFVFANRCAKLEKVPSVLQLITF